MANNNYIDLFRADMKCKEGINLYIKLSTEHPDDTDKIDIAYSRWIDKSFERWKEHPFVSE
jgi:hypothetical protein